MKFGYFDDALHEYVITQPDTPLPWINYLGTQDYYAIISNTAGGYSFYQDARLRRISRYRYNNIPTDTNGRYIYIREKKTGEFWSATWQPTRTELDKYTCRHGLGYTTIQSKFLDIEAVTTYFVPKDETLEVWDLTITNHRDKSVSLSLFSFIEFNLWDAMDDATNFQRNLNIAEVEIEDQVIYHKTEYRERRNHFAFFACSEPVSGFDTQRSKFLGPYRGLDRPLVVEQGKASNSIALGWSPVGSHQVELKLAPGKSKRIIFLLGYSENRQDEKFDPPGSQNINKAKVKPVIEKYLQSKNIDQAFNELKDSWQEFLQVCQVNTPDEDTNRMVNLWNAYQCMVTFNMSRSASYFESGIGRGMGFRDSNQDVLGFVHMLPDRARERILDLASTQMEDGGAYHQYQPLTKRGNDAVGGDFNDDPLWLILSTAAYLKESGDFSILNEMVPFDNQPGTESTLYEHLQRSIEYTLNNMGPHDLPLIGRADWNDCLNLNIFSTQPGESFQTAPLKESGTAESIFIAGLFVLAAKELSQIAEQFRRFEDAQQYKFAAERMSNTVLGAGWDGEWFLRAYDAYGEPVGSQVNKEGQLFIEPQGICVMAGIGLDDGKAQKALDAVNERLATTHGIILHQPAFTSYQPRLGEISSYPPGYKENAGVFCHTNPWIMIAEAILGNGDRAFNYYKLICPSAREEISELHKCEPYVYAQMIAGKDAPNHGEAKNSWLTGTAAWNYVAITQWILGVRPTYDGLEVAPVIPKDWDGFTMERIFRGVKHVIHVVREGEGNQVELTVDDEPVEGSIIPLPDLSKEKVEVLVRLL